VTRQESEKYKWVADAVAQEWGWPNDECWQATNFFLKHAPLYDEQLKKQPLAFQNTQEDLARWELEYEDFTITLEELANVSGFSPIGGNRDDVDWEVVADYLLSINERVLGQE